MLRGASKDVLNEVERNLADAMNVVRTIYHDPRLVPGGGASEMTLAHALVEGSKVQEPIISESYKAAGTALEIIPRTLLENCGADIIRVQTQLRAKHAGGIIGAFLSDTAAGGGPRRLPFSSSSSPPAPRAPSPPQAPTRRGASTARRACSPT